MTSSGYISRVDVAQSGEQFLKGTINPSHYVSRWYQPADKQGILDLNALQGGISELAESDYFDWLHNENPADQPIVAVTTETTGGQVVGFIWYIPVRWRCFGASVLAYLGANALVHPDHRRRNIYSNLQMMAVEECLSRGATFIYGFGRPASVKGARAVGFEEIYMPLLVKPFDIKRLARARGFGPGPRVALSLGWRLAEATLFRPQTIKGNLTVQWEAGFDQAFDRFWQRVADKYPIAVIRDHVFLNWRFCSVPFREYEIVVVRDGTELIGYAVLRCAELLGVRSGFVMDLLVEPTARGEEAGLLLLEAATRQFREAGMWMAATLMLAHTQEYALLRRAGYVPCQQWLASRPYILGIRRCSAQIPDRGMADQRHNWFVTLANHDAC